MVINSLLIYDYVGGRMDVNPDQYEVRTSSILYSLVLWLQVAYLWIYNVKYDPKKNLPTHKATLPN